jgi:hypothetical protein
LRDRLNYGSLAIQSASYPVLTQNAVGDVFQLCHHSNPSVLATFNEIRLGFHWLISFRICTADPLTLSARGVPSIIVNIWPMLYRTE